MAGSVEDVPLSLRNMPAPDPTEPFNLVIFGQDSRDGEDENERTNVIMLAHIDPQEQEVWMVSIPRDTRVVLEGHGARKLNAAYDRGGVEMAIEQVELISGEEVNYFITIDFYGFEHVVDAIGGVEIDVPIDIDDPKADFTPDNSAQRIDAGLQVLDGAHALTFVRHRDGYIDADIGRTRAQQLFFRSLISQMQDVSLARLPGVANTLADNITTNLTPLQLMQIAREMRGIGPDSYHSITLPGDWISPFIHLDEAKSAEIWAQFGVGPFETDEDEELQDGEEYQELEEP
jgi:LCP family protein required for cell wall assembly